ncbi:hypothetical protein [Polyangium sorediatum]|uniref:Uncharacterized protein n=1 Tax=Polyangium sorediatum TaxID=889274 RepID=A0ABT6NTC1_9BACT|nr:hypothetical protein [Polyangium sorediatum]MDI1431402.1 hypothetical protein [Polyangium sorediatum]
MSNKVRGWVLGASLGGILAAWKVVYETVSHLLMPLDLDLWFRLMSSFSATVAAVATLSLGFGGKPIAPKKGAAIAAAVVFLVGAFVFGKLAFYWVSFVLGIHVGTRAADLVEHRSGMGERLVIALGLTVGTLLAAFALGLVADLALPRSLNLDAMPGSMVLAVVAMVPMNMTLRALLQRKAAEAVAGTPSA